MGLSSKAAVAARMADTPVNYVAFDLLHLDGRNLRGLPYAERRELLIGLELDSERWQHPRPSPRRRQRAARGGPSPGAGGSRRQALDSPYRPGRRSGEWIKERVWRRQEFVIGGHIPGEGRRADRVGSLLVGYYDRRASELKKGERQLLAFAGAVGSGLNEEHIETLTARAGQPAPRLEPVRHRWPARAEGAPRRLLRARARLRGLVDGVDREGTLRQPAFKGMRDDKDPREVVREA